MGQITRRQFILGASTLLAAPLARPQGIKDARIGWLQTNPRRTAQFPDLFSAAMAKAGWVEGRNLTIDWRFADGNLDQLPRLAAGLVDSRSQVIVAALNHEAAAARKVTRSTPIVVVGASDPVKVGFAQSLARPGGNVTGVMAGDPSFSAKSAEIMAQILPGMRRFASMYSDGPGYDAYVDAIERANRAVGIETFRFPITRPEEVRVALESIKQLRVGALRVALGGPVGTKLDEILSFVSENRIPSIFSNSQAVERGGFVSYIPRYEELTGRAAAIVDRILKGANPAEIPFEYVTRYELLINLKTAKHLGITVPQPVLLRADRVIE